MEKIPIIINPYSKYNRRMKGNTAAKYRSIGGDFVRIAVVRNFNELDSAAREIKKNRPPYLAISGGDGTIHQVLSRFIKIYRREPLPPIVILKGGTMNNISATIKLKGDGYQILARLVRRLENNRPVKTYPRHTMKIGNRYCFIFATGSPIKILKAVYESDRKDIPSVIRVIIRVLNDGVLRPGSSGFFSRLRARVYMDGEELGCKDMLGIIAGTVEDIGMGFRFLYRQKKTPGTFRVIATGVEPFVLVRNILSLRKGRALAHPLHHDAEVKTLRIVSESPFDYTMDGDIYSADEALSVETGPEVKLVSV